MAGAEPEPREFSMIARKAAIAATAVLFVSSPVVCAAAETSSVADARHLSAADLKALTDARVGIIKAALQLTPDQEKLWPAVEDAIRARAANRQARWQRLAELRDNGPADATHDRNPVEIMQRRAETLTQRGADLKKLADAWEPLYKTLSDDQKRRMAFATYAAMRGIRDAIEHQMDDPEDSDD